MNCIPSLKDLCALAPGYNSYCRYVHNYHRHLCLYTVDIYLLSVTLIPVQVCQVLQEIISFCHTCDGRLGIHLQTYVYLQSATFA